MSHRMSLVAPIQLFTKSSQNYQHSPLDSANNRCYITVRTKEGEQKKDKIPDPKGSGTQHIGFLRQCLNIFYECLLKGDMTYDVTQYFWRKLIGQLV